MRVNDLKKLNADGSLNRVLAYVLVKDLYKDKLITEEEYERIKKSREKILQQR